MTDKKIRALVIDDSALMRKLISNYLNSTDSIEVIATAFNGRFGLNKLTMLRPDIVILDLEMPELNGIEFLKEKNRLDIKTPVIILSAHAKKGARITLEALSLGASDFILKPAGQNSDIREPLNKLVEIILALAKPESGFLEEKQAPIRTSQPFLKPSEIEFKYKDEINATDFLQPINYIPEIKVIVIGISTGGPNALRTILPCFPKDFPVPIVIVQHMPPGFTYEFALHLDKICPLAVKEVEDNDVIMPGRIFIAPGSSHIRFLQKKLATVLVLDDSAPVNSHKPAAEILFKSAAEVYGKNTLACIMTGMGKDGAENIGTILKKGGITIAQDQTSCVVFGMPKMAIKNRNIQIVKPLDQIVETIKKIVLNSKLD